MRTERTHDVFYANEDHKSNVKESFKYIGNKVLKFIETKGYRGGGG